MNPRKSANFVGEFQDPVISLDGTPWSDQYPKDKEPKDYQEAVQFIKKHVTDINFNYFDRHIDTGPLTNIGLSSHHIKGYAREWRKSLNVKSYQKLYSQKIKKKLFYEWNERKRTLTNLSVEFKASPAALARVISGLVVGTNWGSTILQAADRYFRRQIACQDILDSKFIGVLDPKTQGILRRLVNEASVDNLWSISLGSQKNQALHTEQSVIADIRTWVRYVPFETENNQHARGEQSDTPDILFQRPVKIKEFKEPIRWIEIKSGLVIPGLTSIKIMGIFMSQISRYTKRFGSGLIIWMNGWSPEIKTKIHNQIANDCVHQVYHSCPHNMILNSNTDVSSSKQLSWRTV